MGGNCLLLMACVILFAKVGGEPLNSELGNTPKKAPVVESFGIKSELAATSITSNAEKGTSTSNVLLSKSISSKEEHSSSYYTEIKSVAVSSSLQYMSTSDVSVISSNLISSNFPTPSLSIYTSAISPNSSSSFISSIISQSNVSSSMLSSNITSELQSSNFSFSTQIPFSSFAANSSLLPLSTSFVANISLSTSITFNASSTIIFNITSIEPSSMHTIIPISHMIQNASSLKPAKQDCNVVLLGLSDAMANMSHCSILNLRPMHVCESCSDQLQGLRRYHKVAFSDCGSELIREYNDQYQLIPKMYSFADTTWRSLDCDKCYKPRSSYTDAWILADEFIRFKHLLAETMFCFRNNSNVSLPYSNLTPWNETLHINTSSYGDVCKSCKYPYFELQKYFKSLNDETAISSEWCADIVYAINQTRFIWSKTFDCSHRKKDIESVVALTCFFCFLPIMFYVGTKLHADVKDRKHDENDTRLHYESD